MITVTDERATSEERPDPDATPTRMRPGAAPAPDVALGVETVVVAERGRWAVDIVVVFADGVVRRRIDTYPTRARAELSASLIRRAADRDLRGPGNG